MHTDIRSILTELYALDPSMKQHEAEIERIVREMLSAAPDVKIDAAFLAQLRARLMAQAELLAHQAPVRTGLFARIGAPVFALGGVVAAIAIILPVVYFQTHAPQGPGGRPLALKQTVTDVAGGSFGALSTSSAPDQQGKSSAPATVRPQSGGGGGYAGMTMSSEASGVSMPSPLIAPDFTTYRFSYKGEPLTQESESLPVYRKTKDYALAQRFASLFNADLGAIDMQQLRNARVTYVNIVEDREHGYALYVNLDDNSVSINTNWERWPELSLAPEPIPGTLPQESEILSIVDAFVKQYGIDLSSYGQPKIMPAPDFRVMTKSAEGQTMPAYLPMDVSVLYPLIVDGKTTIDEGGGESGLMATVSLRTKTVTSFGNIETPNYERSLYSAETDTAKLIAAAERGGIAGLYPQPEGTKVVTLELGTPTIALMRTWQYNESLRIGRELLIPAYVFPIQNKPKDYWQNNVAIPLIKDIFSNRYEKPVPLPMGRGGMEPMPLIESAPAVKE